MNTQENWLPIVGYEGLYEVSDQGRVRSLDRVIEATLKDGKLSNRNYKGKRLSPSFSTYYPMVRLCSKSWCVHTLVLTAFVGPRPAGHDGCHEDNNPYNNRLDNLRWDTHGANLADRVRHGTLPMGEKMYIAKLKEEEVLFIRSMKGIMSYTELAEKYGVAPSTIGDVLAGRTWKHLL